MGWLSDGYATGEPEVQTVPDKLRGPFEMANGTGRRCWGEGRAYIPTFETLPAFLLFEGGPVKLVAQEPAYNVVTFAEPTAAELAEHFEWIPGGPGGTGTHFGRWTLKLS